jgi:hypothetical protein
MPIIGIIASGISGNLTPTSDFYSIQSNVLGSSSSTITFNSVPSTYRHLQLRVWASSSTLNADIYVYLNNESSSANYQTIYWGSNGSNVPGGAQSATPGAYLGLNATASGYPWAATMNIYDYKNTNAWKSMITNSGSDRNDTSTGTLYHHGSIWKNTSAVSRVDVVVAGATFVAGSVFALYGWS